MAVHLEGGHVVFQYSFRGRSPVRLRTRHTYNKNSWVTVVVSRLKLEGRSHIPRCLYVDTLVCVRYTTERRGSG